MFSLPAPREFFCFRVRFRFLTFEIFCFRFQSLKSKCFRFHKNSTASASSFRFHFPAQYETANRISCKKKQASLLYKLFYLTCVVDRAWFGMEDDFCIFHTGNFRPFHTKNLPFHTPIFFHIPFHTSIPKKF